VFFAGVQLGWPVAGKMLVMILGDIVEPAEGLRVVAGLNGLELGDLILFRATGGTPGAPMSG
jgi:hypothetical protein